VLGRNVTEVSVVSSYKDTNPCKSPISKYYHRVKSSIDEFGQHNSGHTLRRRIFQISILNHVRVGSAED
jgi:hypothetical protein